MIAPYCFINIWWVRDKTAANLQMPFENALLWMKSFVLWLNFHLSLFLVFQITVRKHWVRLWLGTEQVTSHCMKQRGPSLQTHICVTRSRWVKNGNQIGNGIRFRLSVASWRKNIGQIHCSCHNWRNSHHIANFTSVGSFIKHVIRVFSDIKGRHRASVINVIHLKGP